jgi:hypothetical protein
VSRPPIPINWDKVDELLMAGCPGTEVAAFFGMHEDTFYRRVNEKYSMGFTEYMAKKKATGEALLRMQQYNKAMGISKKGDNTLLIFLGKQRLGQRENPNDKVAPEEVMKAFNDLMKQIDKAQEERARTALQNSSVAVCEESDASTGSASPVSINTLNQSCRESPFR